MENWQENKRERPGGIKFKISGDFAVWQNATNLLQGEALHSPCPTAALFLLYDSYSILSKLP